MERHQDSPRSKPFPTVEVALLVPPIIHLIALFIGLSQMWSRDWMEGTAKVEMAIFMWTLWISAFGSLLTGLYAGYLICCGPRPRRYWILSSSGLLSALVVVWMVARLL